MKRISWHGLLAALALLATACDESIYDPAPLVHSMIIAPDTATLPVGTTLPLNVELRTEDGSPIHGFEVVWSSEDPAVARVSGSGVVTAVGEGRTRIVATAARRTVRATVDVVRAPIAALEILGDSVLVLERAQSAQLIAIGRDAAGNAQNGVIPAWTSSDEDGVWVSATGGIVARRGGTYTITATFEGRTATVRVRVPAIRWIDVLPKDGRLVADSSLQARAEVHTESGTRQIPVQWASENPEIAVVSESGRITPVRAGTAVIRAAAEGVEGRGLIVVDGERLPLRAMRADGRALPAELHETMWTDAHGNLQRGTLVLAGAQLAMGRDGRYTQRIFVQYAQGGVTRGAHTFEDVGRVMYDFMTGDLMLVSDRFPGRQTRGVYEFVNGFPSGRVTLTQRIGTDGEPIGVLYRQ